MESGHFNYFRVKNFKRFRDLEVKDIGQFNLVLGDNNVGKTSLLEALMLEKKINIFSQSLNMRLLKRGIGNKVSDGIIGVYINSDAKLEQDEVSLELESNIYNHKILFDKVLKYTFHQPEDGAFDIDRFINDRDNDMNYSVDNKTDVVRHMDYFEPLITGLDKHDTQLTKQYSKLIQSQSRHIKEKFIKELRTVDSSILNLEVENVSTEQPLITIESSKQNSRVLLAFYGDGLIGIFRILLFIHLFKNKRLMIDEIDAGIYHDRMKEYWKVILSSASENNVQLFATTHNRECIKAYQEALEELGDEFEEKSRTIRLVEHDQSKDIVAFTSSYEKMVEELSIGNEVR